MKLLNLIVFVTTILFFFSCEKVITIKPPSYNGKPSIQGMLEVDSIPKIYFNNILPYFDTKVNFQELVIRNAQVKLQSSVGVDSLRLDSVFNKLYCQYDYFYKGNIPIQLNKNYTLIIVSGANNFTATANTFLAKAAIDSTSYTPTFSDLYGEHEGVIVYFKSATAQTNYYRYEMVRFVDTSTYLASAKSYASTCLDRTRKDSTIVHELGRSVYSSNGQNGQQIKIVIEPAYTHKNGTKGLVYIQTIDKNAYDFFDQLDKQKLTQFNPFVEPVFLRDGQFGSKAIGYFSAMVKSNSVAYVFPE